MPTSAAPVAPVQGGVPAPVLNFGNTEVAFRHLSNAQLRRANLLFSTVQFKTLADLGPRVVNCSLRVGLPIEGLLKTFLFDHFCAGTTLPQAAKTLERLQKQQVYGILDYGVEGAETDEVFDHTLAELLKSLDFAAQQPGAAFVAAKLTGLGPFSVMEKRQAGQPLSPAEQAQWERLRQRLFALCDRAAQLNQPVCLDAEESWIQDSIDALCEEAIVRCNTKDCVVYTTVQMYRHDRLDYLKALHQRMQAAGVPVGIKLVRGAYLEKENERAREKGYPTPMQPNKAATDRDYDLAATYILDHLADFGVIAGTHNEASTRHLATALVQHGHPANHPRVWFSQLYGMSDTLSFNLAQAGFRVAKYLPYGPLRAVLPYLFRRAQENSSISGQTGRELRFIRQELARRRRSR